MGKEKKSRDGFLLELDKLEIPTGAHVILWGSGSIVSRLIAFIQWIWLGVRNAPTHVQRSYNKYLDFSAEWNGVRLIDREKKYRKARRVVIALHAKFQEEGIEGQFVKNCNKYNNAKYDFFFYFLVLFRVFIIFSPIVMLWTGIVKPLSMIPMAIIYAIIYWPLNAILRRKSKKSWACAELSNQQDNELGIPTGIKINHNTSPLYYHRIIQAAPQEFDVLIDSGWLSKK